MFSTKFRVAAVLAGLLLAAPAMSFAQGPGGGGGRGGFGGGRGGGGLSGLVRMEEVQKELAVTDEQKAELTKLAEAARGGGGGGGPGGGFDFEAFQKLSDDEKAKQMADLAKQREERTKKSDEAITALLKPEQLARLSELRNQREGVRSLNREDVQKQLGLSAEQVQKVKDLIAANPQGGGFGGFGGGRGGPGGGGGEQSEEEMRKASEERAAKREAFDKDMAAVLTADQAAAWVKAQGAKFEFPAGGRGGPGGGGAGGAGGGRRRPE